MKKEMKRTEEVSQINQVVALMDFLTAMGYETGQLTIIEVMYLKRNIIETIDEADLDPYSEFMENKEADKV
jgi:hypothetical protein